MKAVASAQVNRRNIREDAAGRRETLETVNMYGTSEEAEEERVRVKNV
jgi:hypothetical protein